MAALRARTRDAHTRVDSAFSAYNLNDRDDYCMFLLAHARVLPVIEAMLATSPALPHFRCRTPLLAADIASLGQQMPPPLPFVALTNAAAVWGTFYVVEGSRMGSIALSKRLPAAMPSAYLRAKHEPGEWAALGDAINAEADRNDGTWLNDAVQAGIECFDFYRLACSPVDGSFRE